MADSKSIDFPWKRRIQVEFEGLSGVGSKVMVATGKHISDEKDNYRIVATINKAMIGLAPPSTIMLWNLSPETRASFVRNQTKVRVKAGWDEGPYLGLSQCFYGNLLSAIHSRSGPDIITTLSVQYWFDLLADKELSKPYRAGTPVTAIVQDLYNKIGGLQGLKIKGIDNARIGSGGYSDINWVKEWLDRLGKYYQFSWTIIDGVMQVLADENSFGKTAAIKDPYLIMANPILNGPMQAYAGVQWSCVFDPNIVPGHTSTINSKFSDGNNPMNGSYLVQSVSHILDCHSPQSFVSNAVARVVARV